MELISFLQNEFVRDNNDIQGFGGRYDSTLISTFTDFSGVDSTTITSTELYTAERNLLPQIAPGKSKIVNFKPLCGLFAQDKYLPLKFVPITLEFELCDTNDAIITPAAYDSTTSYDTVYTAANTTNKWQIQNCCIKADICTLDNALNNSYVEHLLSGKSLPI